MSRQQEGSSMSAPKPAWVTSKYGAPYGDLVKSWGYEIAESKDFGYYQGDYVYLLRDGDRYGLIVIGYGSCSGCDELQAVQPWDDDGDWSGVIELADRLRGEIHWEADKDTLMQWASANPENHWWAWDSEIRRWLNDHGATLEVES